MMTYITICKSCKDKARCPIRTASLTAHEIKGDEPSFECPHIKRRRPPGLGDRVAAFLKRPVVAGMVKALTGVDTYKPCGRCRRRQAWLNRLGHP